MTCLGDLLGYDLSENDIMGVNRASWANCIVCGRSALHHTREQEVACLQAVWGQPSQNRPHQAAPTGRSDRDVKDNIGRK